MANATWEALKKGGLGEVFRQIKGGSGGGTSFFNALGTVFSGQKIANPPDRTVSAPIPPPASPIQKPLPVYGPPLPPPPTPSVAPSPTPMNTGVPNLPPVPGSTLVGQVSSGIGATILDVSPKPSLTPPAKPFSFTPTTTVEAKDYITASQHPETLPKFYGTQFQGVQELQQSVVDTRAQQPTNVQDLTSAQQLEGLTASRARYDDILRRKLAFDQEIRRVESDVRRDLAGGRVTESFVRAEINNRLKQIEPRYSDLLLELESAGVDIQLKNKYVTDRFNASRADSAESVNRVAQQLGFKQENINAAITMMAGVKAYELSVDAQRDKVRDDARAGVALLNATPGAWKNITPTAIAQLENEAQVPRGTYAGVRDAMLSGEFLKDTWKVGDDGSASFGTYNNDTGIFKFHRIKDYATIVKTTSASSIQEQKLISNASPAMQEVYQKALKIVGAGINDVAGGRTDPAQLQDRISLASIALGQVALQTKNPADMELYENFKTIYQPRDFIADINAELLRRGFPGGEGN